MKLEVQNGVFRYPGTQRDVLQDIAFTVHSGEILAVLGPNGAGKTTLLRCIMGFLPWTRGQSLLDGEPLPSIPTHLLWQKLAYVPQARGRAGGATVLDTVLLGRASRIGTFRQPGEHDRAVANEVLEQLHIAHLSARRCDEISGGELQMVLIARALAAQPQCIILDEPESNLDFKNRLIVLQTLETLRTQGIACVFNTHYPEHALRYADNALLLDKTGHHSFGRSAAVVTEENIAAAFGVRSIIGEVETDHSVYHDVVPIAVLEDTPPLTAGDNTPVLASLSVVLTHGADVAAVNALLHSHRTAVQGRFGMPCPAWDTDVITLVLSAAAGEVHRLVGQLNTINGVSAKATFAAAQQEGKYGIE